MELIRSGITSILAFIRGNRRAMLRLLLFWIMMAVLAVGLCVSPESTEMVVLGIAILALLAVRSFVIWELETLSTPRNKDL